MGDGDSNSACVISWSNFSSYYSLFSPLFHPLSLWALQTLRRKGLGLESSELEHEDSVPMGTEKYHDGMDLSMARQRYYVSRIFQMAVSEPNVHICVLLKYCVKSIRLHRSSLQKWWVQVLKTATATPPIQTWVPIGLHPTNLCVAGRAQPVLSAPTLIRPLWDRIQVLENGQDISKYLIT